MDVTEISKLAAAVHLEERGDGEEQITRTTTKIRRKGGGSSLSLRISKVLANIGKYFPSPFPHDNTLLIALLFYLHVQASRVM